MSEPDVRRQPNGGWLMTGPRGIVAVAPSVVMCESYVPTISLTRSRSSWKWRVVEFECCLATPTSRNSPEHFFELEQRAADPEGLGGQTWADCPEARKKMLVDIFHRITGGTLTPGKSLPSPSALTT